MTNYLVATVKPWNVEAFHRHAPDLAGGWHLISSPEELEPALERLEPRYVFFPHWSWKVSRNVIDRAECVCFHMTDVPYGRGGSPLQNLIARGHRETMLSALRMVEELDAGPVYGKRALSLEGRAEDIYRRAADLVYELIAWIVSENPMPRPQAGPVVRFRRRRPAESRLPETADVEALLDHIRMLDAPTYPRAFVRNGPWRIELSDAELAEDGVTGRFLARLSEDDE